MAFLSMVKDINGLNTFLRSPIADAKYSAVLTALGGNKTVTVPTDSTSSALVTKYVAIFSYQAGSKIWVAVNHTAVAPTGDPSSTNSELCPVGYLVLPGDVINAITDDTSAEWGVTIYAVQ